MIVRLLLAALAAGLIAGMAMTPAQYAKIVPLILHAETFETSGAGHDHGASGTAAAVESAASVEPVAHDHSTHDHEDDGSAMDLSRLGNTLLANLVAGCGFALMLAAVALLSGFEFPKGREGVVRGVLLGAAGWFSVQLAPAFSLPPELPGFPYADLFERQSWWMTTVALSAAGAWLMAVRREWVLNLAGVVLIVAPHIWGAPQPADISSDVPALLAAEYASAALATTLFFWLLLGGLLGSFLSRVPEEQTA
ncbi:MAG: CbtA family protein [Hoeflea sp.]|uniref:CbtA family protein n=1 Tax=Hoeflea sp. TaxID=1940281 RepID=UPI003EF0C53B